MSRWILVVILLLGAAEAAISQSGRPDSLLFRLQINTLNKESNKPISGVLIELSGSDGLSWEILSDSTGYAESRLASDTDYSIRASKEYTLFILDQLSTKGLRESTTFIKEYYMAVLTGCSGSDRSPLHVFFKHAKDSVEVNDDELAIQEFKALLDDNPTIIVELTGHRVISETDGIQTLRVEYIKQRLIEEGVNPERIELKSDPAYKEHFTLDEAGLMELVTFQIVRWDHIPKP